jgi:hypothetical protein
MPHSKSFPFCSSESSAPDTPAFKPEKHNRFSATFRKPYKLPVLPPDMKYAAHSVHPTSIDGRARCDLVGGTVGVVWCFNAVAVLGWERREKNGVALHLATQSTSRSAVAACDLVAHEGDRGAAFGVRLAEKG